MSRKKITYISHSFHQFKTTPLEIKSFFNTKDQKSAKIFQQSAEVGLEDGLTFSYLVSNGEGVGFFAFSRELG